jgi:glutamate 5-kinase
LRLSEVIAVDGSFPAQSVVSMRDPEGVEFARGIIQKKSAEIKDNIGSGQFASFTATHEVIESRALKSVS